MFLKPGQRGLLIGKTGSGKTQDALFQLANTEMHPVIILDTKIEDAFFSLRKEADDESEEITLELCQSFEELELLSKLPKHKMPDYILVRPPSSEVVHSEMLDKYLQLVYAKFGPCFFYADEVAHCHHNSRPLPGLMELLTRGRSRKKTVLMGNQRPVNISRSCISESDKFYIHKLLDMRDRQTLDYAIPDFSSLESPPKYHFYFFDASSDDPIKLFKPVPETKQDPTKIFKRKWL